MNLVHLLGLPEQVTCPLCDKAIYLWFDDYDMDCRRDEEPGVFTLNTECETCNRKVKVVCRVTPIVEYLSVGEPTRRTT